MCWHFNSQPFAKLLCAPHAWPFICSYLGYNALKDFFPTMELKPNVACVNPRCIALQVGVIARSGIQQVTCSLEGLMYGRIVSEMRD